MAASDLKGVFYSQKSRQAGDWIFNKGEDAMPFVCDDFMLVADGLGGDGLFVHTQMNPAMWNRQERQALFEVPEEDEALSAYFDSLFAEMDRDAVDGKKPERYAQFPKYELHSGYFGSRIAAFAFASLLKQDSEVSPQALFAALDEAADETKRREQLDCYAARLCEKLMERVAVMAQRGGFVLEGDEHSTKLLPTTLAAALYRDLDEETQVICLWAGDSRIVAQLADGCAQLTEDDEKNEAITNLISLSTQPHLNVREYRFPRPFALMAVSDGTFDDMGGALCFEAMVVLDPMSCDSEEAMQQTWTKLFINRSTDDSATIAYCFFGMETMEACRTFAAPRTETIQKEYLGQLPELFSADFTIEGQRLARKTKTALRPFLDEVKADPHVAESYIADEKRLPSAGLMQAKRAIEVQRRLLDDEIRGVYENARMYYEEHWTSLRPVSEDWKLNDLADRLRAGTNEKASLKQQYKDRLLNIKSDAERMTGELAKQIEKGIDAADSGVMNCSPKGIEQDMLTAIMRMLDGITEELKGFLQGWDVMREYSKATKRTQRDCESLLKYEAIVLKKAVAAALSGETERVPEAIEKLRQEYRRLEEKKTELRNREEEAIREAAVKRANNSLGSILENLMSETGLLGRLSENLRARIGRIIGEYRTQAEELRAKEQKQKELFEAAEKHYMRFIQEEKTDGSL